MDALDPILHQTLIVIAVLSFPLLGVAALCGLLVAILQAATQVQEQTLTVLPKLVVVGAMIALGGSFAMRLFASLLTDALLAVPAIVRGS